MESTYKWSGLTFLEAAPPILLRAVPLAAIAFPEAAPHLCMGLHIPRPSERDPIASWVRNGQEGKILDPAAPLLDSGPPEGRS
jgi:hypothetical protein